MRFAVSGETPGKQYTLQDILGFLRSYGASAIEIWPENIPACQGETIHRLYKNRDVELAADMLAEADVSVACVAFGAAFDKDIAGDAALYSAELARAVDVAARLGAKFVNHYLYYISMDERADIDRLKLIYAPALEIAHKHGITLVLENEAHDSTKDPTQMLRIVKAMDSSCFKTNFDAVNYFQALFEGFPYAYEMLKEHIAYVHIKDGCKYVPDHGHTVDCMGGSMCSGHIYYPMMGTGFMNNHGLLQRLKEDGYSGWCTLEPHTSVEKWHEYIQTEIRCLTNTGLFA